MYEYHVAGNHPGTLQAGSDPVRCATQNNTKLIQGKC